MPKTIFITGCSSGIGKATAMYFAAKGWNVAATLRNPDAFTELDTYPNVRKWKLDVTQVEQIKEVWQEAISHFQTIDVVFNNAGYALVGSFEAMEMEQIKRQFETNVFGVMSVIKTVLPYFREKRTGIIINTSSMGGLITFPLYSPYHATKWALEGFTESLQYELRAFNIRIKNIEPGAIRTDFEKALDFTLHDAYQDYAPRVHQNMLDTYKTAPGPDAVVRKVFEAANDSSFRLRYPVGNNAPLFLLLRRLLPLSWYTSIVRMVTEKK